MSDPILITIVVAYPLHSLQMTYQSIIAGQLDLEVERQLLCLSKREANSSSHHVLKDEAKLDKSISKTTPL